VRSIVCIVEGDGEVKAVPVLLRRIAEARGIFDLNVGMPIRVHRDQFLRREDEFRRKLLLAAAKAGDGQVIVLLDADDDCPVDLARDIAARAGNIVPHVRLAVVIARHEYEAWLLAGANSLAGKRGLSADLEAPADGEAIRDAKGWLSNHIQSGRYHEVSDQPALTAVLDIDLACAGSRSFRKFVKECEGALVAFSTAE
jgi:hypothetical protein